MKKITLLLFMLFATFSYAQLQVGTGTNEGQNMPFEPYYGYSYSQSIYTAAEINTSGTITGLQYYFSGTSLLPNSQDITIYIGHTTKSAFASNTDWEPVAGLTASYTGGIDVSAGAGWVTITLTTPFAYNGTDNLIIAFDENLVGFDSFGDDFWNTATPLVRSITYRSDSVNPDPAAPPTASGTYSYAPTIIFNGLVASNPPNCDSTLTDISAAGDVTWTAATGSPSGYKLSVGTSTGATDIANAIDVGDFLTYNVGALNAGSTYYVTIVPYNANGDATGCVEQTFTVPCLAPTALTASNITTSSAQLGWTESGTATLWNVEVVDITAGGIATGTATAIGVANPYELTGLEQNNSYEFYVQADCGGAVSTWAGPFAFNTACVAIVAPYTEDFELFTVSASAFNNQNCWTATNIGGYLWEVAATTDTSSGGTGPGAGVSSGNYLFTEASSGSAGDAIDLVSPSIDLSGLTSPSLFFDYHMFGGDMGSLEVLVNGTTSVFTLTGQQQIAETEAFQTAIVDLTAYAGQTIQVTFRGIRGAGFESDMAIDNVAFNEAPSCFDPTSLNATNITDSSADLGWTENGTATVWNVELVDITAGGVATGIATSTGVANPFLLTGLAQNNDYEFYVQADCGTSGVSNWSGPFAFSTLCSPILAPYTEDFESFTVATSAFNSENCWTGTNIGGYLWEVAATTDTSSGSTGPGSGVSSGNYLFTEASSGATGDAIDLVSPSIDLSGLTAPALIFDYHMFGADMGTLDVLVNGTTNVFSLMGQQQTAETDSFITAIVDLTAYTGQTIQVTFRGTKGAGFTSDMAIDNVSFNEAPSCLQPTALAASNITTTTADLSWTAGGTETIWNIEVVDITAGGTATGIATVSGVTNPYALSGLTPNNDYEYYVQADCGTDGVSSWVGPFAFRTGYCIPSGTNTSTYINTFSTTLADTNISNLASGLSASNYGDFFNTQSLSIIPGGTFDFNIEIVSGTVGCAIWVDWNNDLIFDVSEAMYSTTSYGSGPFTGSILVPATAVNGDYRMRVMIDWNDSNPGDDSACSLASGRGEVEDYKITVDSSLSTLDFDEEIGFSYYPNPVNDNLTLQAQKEITNVSVYNMIGQEVYRNAPNTLTNEVNMSNLQSGAYFVKVTVGNATETIKVIKN